MVRDGGFYAGGGRRRARPPSEVYRLAPTTMFGFGTDETFGATRWRL